MKTLKRLFNIYIYGSMHVGLSVFALVLMTNHMLYLPFNPAVAVFAFCGTMFSYNFMKYESVIRYKKPINNRLKVIFGLTAAAFLGACISFLFLERVTQITAVVFFGLTALYTVPFFPNTKNLRNWSGIKIYIVALCWAGITIVLPLMDANVPITSDAYLKFGQRFILVIVLILIFEIIDLSEDDPFLKTVPQQIGVKKTKWLNLCLLVPLFFLEFFKSTVDPRQLVANFCLAITAALFTIYAHPHRNKYYTLFWVESIPIFWLGLVILVNYL